MRKLRAALASPLSKSKSSGPWHRDAQRGEAIDGAPATERLMRRAAKEIDERLADLSANPATGRPWADVRAGIVGKHRR